MEKTEIVIAEEAVRNQVASILNCSEIKNSQILARFLEFVVMETLSGHRDEIKEYTIGVKALGRPSDFNPQLDAVVRIHAGRLRRILFQYYQGEGKDDLVIISIPKGTYIPVFELRNNHVELITDIKKPALALEQKDRYSSKPVIAVIPFKNLSSENSKDYFVTGIGEQLSISLARFENVSVISYFSSDNFDSAKDLKEMHEKTGIDYVLTGSLRFNEETVRLNAELILPKNGEIIWTDTLIRHLNSHNIFDIQEEIINQVLNVVADDIGIITQRTKYNNSLNLDSNTAKVLKAIQLYHEYASGFNSDALVQAITALEEAVELNPQHSSVCSMLASMYMDTYLQHLEEDPELLIRAFDLAKTAVHANDQSQRAHKSLAWALLLTGKKEKCLEEMESCIKLNPKSSTMISTMALGYICLGEYGKGFSLLLESLHLTPGVPDLTKIGFALYNFFRKNYTESFSWLQRLGTVNSPFISLLQLSLHGKIHKEKIDRADLTWSNMKPYIPSIISRFIFDPELQLEMMDGLMLAGLTVK